MEWLPEAHLTLHRYMYLRSGINESYNSLVLWDEDGSETGSRACRLTAIAREREREAVVHKDDTDGR